MTILITVFPLNKVRSMTNSIAKWDQGHCNVSNDMSLPAGSMRGTLACAKAVTGRDESLDVNDHVGPPILGFQQLICSLCARVASSRYHVCPGEFASLLSWGEG